MTAGSTLNSKNPISLQELLSPWAVIADVDERQVSGVKLDSRQLCAGDVFLAVAGETTHGLDYLADALKVNVAAVIVAVSYTHLTLPTIYPV